MSEEAVSLVIPGRNCAATIFACLEAVVPLLEGPHLREIIFVDDGSTDATADIVADFPVRFVHGSGKGPGAARNIGWREVHHPLVWFVDADCVSESDALDLLLPAIREPRVGAVSGSYGIMNPESLLARLIHEEIIERHRSMPRRVDFLATFNVLYRRAVLEQLSGFDERYLKAQDAELSFRALEAGYELHFVFESRVKHFHPTHWGRYLRTQRQQGYWRVFLHLSHAGHTTGDSYSRLLDHLQPPLAVASLASVPLAWIGRWGVVPPALALSVLLMQWPMTRRLVRRTGAWRYLAFAPMGFLRTFWRGIGMTHGVLAYLLSGSKCNERGA